MIIKKKIMITNKQFIEFHEKIDILKHLRRTGWGMKKVPNSETVAAHSWRMALMAMQREAEFKLLQVDTQRIIEMCLLHDIAEAVVGDIVPEHEQHTNKKILPAEKKAMEINAIENFSTKYSFPKLKALFMEYEEHQTLEARIVKNLDKIDMILQAYEYLIAYPELTKLNDFLLYNEQYVDLPIFQKDMQEIKKRQTGKKPHKNDFIDLQMLAGKMKHIPYPTPEQLKKFKEIMLADYAFSIAVMALHLEDNLKQNGLNVIEIVHRSIICSFGKVSSEHILSLLNKPLNEVEIISEIAQKYNAPFIYNQFEAFQQKTPENDIIADLCSFENDFQIGKSSEITTNFNRIFI